MKAEDIAIDGLIRFTEGKVDLHGRRLIIQDFHALAQFRRDIVEMVGDEQARRIFTRLGYFWGQADAAAMIRIFEWDNTTELLKSGPILHMLQGVARTELNILELDENEERFRLEFIWHDSGEADAYVSEMGSTKHSACWILVGYASGFASYVLNKSVYFVERKCHAKGDSVCLAEGRDVDSWDEEITSHLKYFHADDIKGKIRVLSAQLKKREKELAIQRKQLEQALHTPKLLSIEVRSRRFQKVLDIANQVAKFDSSILVTGETGVGKEVLARYIHNSSPRSDGSFIAVNCAALPETLIESELFGHKAGSFTDARWDKKGLFEEAEGGTIFLDEIGDISPNMQLKLLRVLQEKEILRIGETRPRKVDVRVIGATNRNLEQKVKEGSFREDFFYRLQVIQIEVPPLRERREDILPLINQFVKNCEGKLGLKSLRLNAKCLNLLINYYWPGNIRELENAIEHAAVLCQGNEIFPENLPSRITSKSMLLKDIDPSDFSLNTLELKHIQRVLEMTNGHRAKAAELLGIGETTLYRKLKQLEQTNEI